MRSSSGLMLGIATASARVAAFCIAAVLFVCTANAQDKPLRGVALVIGQSNYQHLASLPNPEKDADAIEALLSDLGFDSVRRTDREASTLSRDLERFAEDAENADVAVLYYSGHGIEAGGENFLVPIDADLSALDDAGEKLVPVSALIEKLKATVPIAIVMLDACRDNPFPPGSQLRLSVGAAPVPVATSGLGQTRSAVRLGGTPEPAPPTANVGTVIAFAAEPGKVALDGDAGGNSPYASAVLRHFDAMGGQEFGMVMRMVAEEVYLKTGGRQRPWVNESLRRQLYFGEAPHAAAGAEGDILRERRQLLVKIADLPAFRRDQVERVAADGGVPMDAVYAILEAIGTRAPEDPAEMEKLLRSQAAELKNFFEKQQSVERPDPELTRIATLTDEAVAEGAIATARKLRLDADRRISELDVTLDTQEANLKARRLEFGAEFARSAEVSALAFDHLAAANYYDKAYSEVQRWDDDLAWRYRSREIDELTSHGLTTGDNAALDRAIDAARQSVDAASRVGDRQRWADAQVSLGFALLTIGGRGSGTARLQDAADAFRGALTVHSRDVDLGEWISTQNNLGFTLFRLGERDGGPEVFKEAIALYRNALSQGLRETLPDMWGSTQFQLGSVLTRLYESTGDVSDLNDAVTAFEAALQVESRAKDPFGWAVLHNNLGMALWRIGERETGLENLEKSAASFNEALQEMTRERAPSTWAGLTQNLSSVLIRIAQRSGDKSLVDRAITNLRSVLEVQTRASDPFNRAMSQVNLGVALVNAGIDRKNDGQMREGIVELRFAIEEFRPETTPTNWATAQQAMGVAYLALGDKNASQADLREALAAFELALTARTPDTLPIDWAFTVFGHAVAEARLGEILRDRAMVERARSDLDRAADMMAQKGVTAMAAQMAERRRKFDAILDGFPTP